MDINYLYWLRELVSLGVYKAIGVSHLRSYRKYYLQGLTPYSSVYQQFDDDADLGLVISQPDESPQLRLF